MNIKKDKSKAVSFLKTNKFKYATSTTIFTAVFIAIVIAVNVFSGVLVERFPSLNADLTTEGLYSLSDDTIKIAKTIERPTEIFIIGTKDEIENDTLYANYGLKYSQVSNLSSKLNEVNSNITVEFVDPDLEPQLIAEYSSDALEVGKVLVRTDLRHTVLTATDLFSIVQDQTTSQYKYFSKVDGALANAINLVNLDNVPVISVATGHGELLNKETRATFDKLVADNGFMVNEFDILTSDIPEDTDIVMVATPSTDYTEAEIEKLNEFLAQGIDSKSVLVTCYPTQEKLPNLASFLDDWGIVVGEGIVVETSSDKYLSGSAAYVLSDVVNENFADNTYTNIVSAASAPLTFSFETNNETLAAPLVQTSETAYVSVDGSEMENPVLGTQVTASLSQKLEYVDSKPVYTSVLVFGDSYQFTANFLGSSAFGNRDLIIDALQKVTGTQEDSLSLYVANTEINSVDVVASTGTIIILGIYVFTVGIPLLILIAGLIIFLRRRHL